MALRNQLETSGSWLFRYRSYLPLAILPIFFICLASSSYLDHSHEINEFWQAACMVVSFFGLGLRMIVVGRAPLGTSGRNTREQAANTLTTTGMYSVVRPSALFGKLYHYHRLRDGVSCLVAGVADHLHVRAVLRAHYAGGRSFLRTRFGEVFEQWAAVTPAFIPRFRGWKSSAIPFCWRTVLQREYNAFFLIIAVFFLLDFDWRFHHRKTSQDRSDMVCHFRCRVRDFCHLAHPQETHASVDRRGEIGKYRGRLICENFRLDDSRQLDCSGVRKTNTKINEHTTRKPGGPKAVTNKLQGWPQFDDNAVNSVTAVLRSGRSITGRASRAWNLKRNSPNGRAAVTPSASPPARALHVGLASLGIGPGDEVIVPSYTFIATSFSVVQAGAIPRFADVNIEDHCLSVESAEKLVNKRTKAVMPVHLYGNVCDMDKIRAFAKKHKLFVIEDNAEAFGGEYKGKKTGTLSDIAGCSFCQNKTFTTGGEGGMVTTDDEDLAWTARSFRDHGYDVKQRLSLLELEQKLPYIHNMIGWNYRMTEMQSAIGLRNCNGWNRGTCPAAAATRKY